MELLDKILRAFGFSDNRCNMVARSFNNCHYSILVNGKASGFFTARHGIKQGDPLSPALFILANEYLSRGLNHMFSSSPDLYFGSEKGVKVSHLAYADDLILFTRGRTSGLKKIMDYLQHYENVSGQKINKSKSDIYLGKRASARNIISTSGLNVKAMPFTYLGAPIVRGKKKASYYDAIVEKIASKLKGWIEFVITRSKVDFNQKCSYLYACVPSADLPTSCSHSEPN